MQEFSNSPFFRALAVIVPGMLLAVYLAVQVGNGNLPIAAYFLIGVVVLLGVKISTNYVRLEGLILGILLFGYIVGQSGFGHFSVSETRGIYFGEIGMVLCAAALLAHIAFTRQKLIPGTSLALAILAFMIVGVCRFIYDVRQSSEPIVVIRDFATVYYAAFYFIAFNICRNATSRVFLQRTIGAAMIVSIFVFSAFIAFPGFFERDLVVHGRPLIEPRADITGSFMGFASVYFFLSGQFKGHPIRWTFLSFAAVVVLLAALSRATFLGFAAAVSLLVIARQSRFVLYSLIFCVIGGLVLLPIALSGAKGEENYAAVVQDKVLSIVEPFQHNKLAFRSTAGEISAGNNEYRATWWKAVIDETNQKSPWVGLGFGYDLAKRFLRTYTAPLNTIEFDARSPHSIILTIYGRMGIVGIIPFGAVIFLILKSSIRCAVAIRRRKTSPMDIAPWCGVIAILVTSCFGVMLEGPMAAIVFWSLLGMASYREWERTQPEQKKVAPVRDVPYESREAISSRASSRLA